MLRNSTKKIIVKIDHIRSTSIVLIQGTFFVSMSTNILLKLTKQQSPVATSPAVNALLHISYHYVVIALVKRVIDQWFEVIPLKSRSILELINEKVVEKRTHFFVDKRSLFISYDPLQKKGGIRNE